MRAFVLTSVLFLFLFSLFIGIDRFIHSKSLHFSLPKISAIRESAEACAMEPLEEEGKKELDALLRQPFTFFGKSNHAYLFLSEDHKYILKLLKRDAFDPKSWLAYIPVTFNPYYNEYQKNLEEKRRTFLAYKTAFKEFKEETGLVYMHIDTITKLNRYIAIFNGAKKAYAVDIDKTNFYIQKRAQLLYPRISELMRSKEIERAKNIISSVFSLTAFLGKRGALDPDLTLCTNIGVIDDKAVQLEIRKLYINPSAKHFASSEQQLSQGMDSFRRWIERNYPELLMHFDSQSKELQAHSEEQI